MSRGKRNINGNILWQIVFIPSYAVYQMIDVLESFNKTILTYTAVNIIQIAAAILYWGSLLFMGIYYYSAVKQGKTVEDEYSEFISFKGFRCSFYIMLLFMVIVSILTSLFKLDAKNILTLMWLVIPLSVLLPNLFYMIKD